MLRPNRVGGGGPPGSGWVVLGAAALGGLLILALTPCDCEPTFVVIQGGLTPT